MSVIECKELTKAYGQAKALNQLTCRIEENKITGLIGRNGAGKTTFLNLIAGHIKPTEGEIKVFSEDPFNNLTVSANTVYIHEHMTFPTALTLQEILNIGESFYPNWDMELANRLFQYFNFKPTQYFEGLSKGMKSTFKMIFGLSAHCPLTIFDEPTSGMDAAVRKDFYRALLKDYIAHPRTFVVSSHHLEEIEDLLEDILLIHDGKERLHLSVSELSEWAIALQGPTNKVEEWTAHKNVLYQKNLGGNQTYLVIQNELSDTEQKQVKADGVKISTVSPNDLCIYLTGITKGGIDDVFN